MRKIMHVPFLDLHAQYLSIKEETDAAIAGVIRDTAFIGGKYVRCFEEEFAAYIGTLSCIGVGNGTDALEIALEALDLPAGSEVLVPANSFIATSEAVTRAGLAPVFCDCDPETYTLSPADAAHRVTPQTRAIIPVHLYGHPCDMEGIMDVARRCGLAVIEDCAQAHGAEYKGKRVGTFGEMGTFSFYPGKNLGAYGDGGAIVTDDDELGTRCRMIANHGRLSKYDHRFEGRNSRLDGLQAAILSAKMKHLEEWTELRRAKARLYKELLADAGVKLPVEQSLTRHVYHLFVIRADRRDFLQAELKKTGIETGIHYPVPLPFLEAYSHFGHQHIDFPATARHMNRLLSLPLYPELDDNKLQRVANAVARLTGSSPCAE